MSAEDYRALAPLFDVLIWAGVAGIAVWSGVLVMALIEPGQPFKLKPPPPLPPFSGEPTDQAEN